MCGRRCRPPSSEPSSHVLSCSHECDYGPVSLAQLPILTSARTKFTSSKDVDDQVRKALGSGESLYAVDEPLLFELKPDVILTQA